MPLDNTVGGANANSYLSVADATALLAERIGAGTDWTGAGNGDKEAALISATRRLDQEEFQGCKATDTQSLQWPRYDTYDRDGYPYSSTEIPRPIELACAELALQLIRNPDLFDDTGLEGYESLTLGDKSFTPNGRRAGALPAHVARHLRGLRLGGDGFVRLIRG